MEVQGVPSKGLPCPLRRRGTDRARATHGMASLEPAPRENVEPGGSENERQTDVTELGCGDRHNQRWRPCFPVKNQIASPGDSNGHARTEMRA